MYLATHEVRCASAHRFSVHALFLLRYPSDYSDQNRQKPLLYLRCSSSATGSVYSQGEGKATVQAGKEVTARITMTKVEDNTGGLVIIIEDSTVPPQGIKPSPFSGACIDINTAALAQCEKDGNGFKITRPEFAPNQCAHLISMPNPAAAVDWDNCRGLPGYQHRDRA